MSLSQKYRELEIKTSLGDDVMFIQRVSGRESLGRPFEVATSVVTKNDDFSFDDLIGTPVSVKIKMGEQGERFVHGFVTQMIHSGYSKQGQSKYDLSIAPWLWFLTKASNCRIFQNKTVPEIIEAVFDEYSDADFELKLNASYPMRTYCVQYRETDFNFVQRLMEHEGIYYFWEHKEGSHKMIICDDMSVHEPAPGFEEIIYRAPGSGMHGESYISSWQVRQAVTPGSYILNSFNFETPSPATNTKLLSVDDQMHPHKQGDHKLYDYPGDFMDLGDGERLATIRREEVQAETKTRIASTNARGLICGEIFTPTEIPRKDQSDKSYLITASQFSASSNDYQSGEDGGGEPYLATFSAIPSDECVFRPSRSARIPRMQGLQTAMVTGPASEEIFVDKFGRVKVQFHWDRDGKYDDGTSCWIRVSQAWAGASFGSMNIPRIGQEVIVDFLEGDPDQPIITGRVYNGENMPHSSNAGRDGKPGNTPPADLTKAAMMSSFKSNSLGGSGGCNEITMNDTGGAEGLFFKAQKDEIHIVGNDREDTVGNDETISIGNDRTETVGNNEHITIGNDRTEEVGNDESITIGANQEVIIGSDKSLDVTGDETIKIGGDQKKDVGGDEINNIGGDLKETIGGDVIMELGGDHIVKTGGDNKVTVTGDRDISVTGKISESSMQQISLSAPMKITLACGPSKIELTPAGITLQTAGLITVQGTMIKLN